MQRIRNFWNGFKNFAIIFSFIMNFVLLVALLIVVQQIFLIKNGIAEPLIDGLHKNFVGLDEAVIIRTVPVDDEITIDFPLLINQGTVVTLNEAVPLSASATFALPGGGGTINGAVSLDLPVGLELPVQLNLPVQVTQDIPVVLDVGVEIPLNETQLHQPFVNLRNLFEPFVRSLDNLPEEWEETPNFAIDVVQGEVDLLRETEDSSDPWDPAVDLPQPTSEDSTGAPPESDAQTDEDQTSEDDNNQEPDPQAQDLPNVGVGGAEPEVAPPSPTRDPSLPTPTTVPLQPRDNEG